ncbi:SusC/RagA family TonB-linked outer membrane protein [Mangrovibacterium lignilyticum]|uniref:SusC/RagA family TonB-linked outer membrane protein n=1 Tax=Mangrovibacterium lignilyticum TaxID=2668052 RepID=UPI0013D75156|nr:SusC/RagA family TonB-linked outer membrane protein [Mangrovibacterium lignilyticum]
MKLTIALLLFLVFSSLASDLYSQGTYSLESKNEKIVNVLQKIEEQSKYRFFYNEEIDLGTNVSIDVKDASIQEILNNLFKDSRINYEIVGRQIILTGQENVANSQQSTDITGIVRDKTGLPIPGATVVLKGSTSGTITDMDGKYTLPGIPSDGTLVFSFVGMRLQEVPIQGRSKIDVTLEEETIGLEEVVAIGYGTMKKRDVTGSVASVTGEQLAAVPVPNAAQALKGKLAGVNVVAQDGRPGADISIRVRGGGSISQSNEPLFIVDGFPVSTISDIPGNQIESIDVLKDASSTAIYGARGANGVIIVTTKSGKAGKLTVTYDGYVKFNRPTKYFPTMSAHDYIGYNWGYAAAISDNYADAWEMLWAIGRYEDTYGNAQGIDAYNNVGATNYSKEVYGNSFSHSHNFNISSGTDKTKYIFSVNHVDEDGMKINSSYKRSNVSFKLDQKLGDKLKFNFDSRFTQIEEIGDESTSTSGGSLLTTAYWFRPIATEDVLGELDESINSQIGFYTDILQDVYNPVSRINDYSDFSRNRSLRANGSLSWEIIDGLTAKTELGLSTNWGRNKVWSGAIYNDYFDTAGNKTFGGNAKIRATEGWNYRWVNTLNYDVQGLGENQSLNILAGMEVADSGSEYTEVWGNYYPASFDSERAFAMMDQYLTGTSTINGGLSSNTGTPNRLQSYFGRANYSLMDKYLLTATFRADGSSRFAPTNRWGYFPAAALAWRMSEESFIKDLGWFDNLKLRLSYGSVGNDGISANLWKMSWASDGLTRYSINEQQIVAYSPASSTIANPDLKWETTITRNLGIDFAFFDSRLYGTLDLYKNTTEDLLMLTSVSAISGFSYTYDNIGATSNKGIELSLGGDIVRSNDFNLRASVNININRGNVDKLAEGVNGLYNSEWGGTAYVEPVSGDYILQEGKPVGQVRGFQYDGWYTVDDFNYEAGQYVLKEGIPDIASGILGPVYGTTDNKPGDQTAYPGVLKLKDIAGADGSGTDGVVDENDIGIIGDMTPKHTGGLNISGNFKNFDFSLDFNWSYGNQIYNANYLYGFTGNKEIGMYRNRLDYLSTAYKIYDVQDGQLTFVTDPAELKALNANATAFLPYNENTVVSTLGIEDGSFLRLNTVTLGYTLPKNLLDKVGVNKLRVYGSIYNVFLLTNYEGADPEVNVDDERAVYPTIGLDYGAYPRARSFTLGVNIEF